MTTSLYKQGSWYMWQGNEGEEWRVYKYSIRVEEAVQGKAEDG